MSPWLALSQLSPPDERGSAGDALAFDDGQGLVDREVPDDIGPAGRPADLELIDLARSAQPEVHASVTLPKVARSGLHFSHLDGASGRETESGANTIAIAARAHCSHQ